MYERNYWMLVVAGFTLIYAKMSAMGTPITGIVHRDQLHIGSALTVVLILCWSAFEALQQFRVARSQGWLLPFAAVLIVNGLFASHAKTGPFPAEEAMWSALVASTAVLAWTIIQLSARIAQSELLKSIPRAICLQCGYNLKGLPTTRCPECGYGG